MHGLPRAYTRNPHALHNHLQDISPALRVAVRLVQDDRADASSPCSCVLHVLYYCGG